MTEEIFYFFWRKKWLGIKKTHLNLATPTNIIKIHLNLATPTDIMSSQQF